ncbi:MAG TPA: YrdB family protein [Kofleriaceae bacterium]
MAMIALTLRFLCEIGALVALGWWGSHAGGIALAIALPVIAGTLWGLFVAPRAARRLRDPLRFVVESVVWCGAIAALVALDRIAYAAAFGAIAFVTAVAARRYEPAAVDGKSR